MRRPARVVLLSVAFAVMPFFAAGTSGAQSTTPPLQVEIDKSKVDLKEHHLELVASRPLAKVTIKVTGDSGTVLDACFALFAGEKMNEDEVARAMVSIFPEHDPKQLGDWVARFVRLFTASIYKWVQAPISLHVGNLDLERERALQLPVVQRSEWQKR